MNMARASPSESTSSSSSGTFHNSGCLSLASATTVSISSSGYMWLDASKPTDVHISCSFGLSAS
ncbi:hypothetical protein BDW02DRAFT_37121 [Decorospora gaudefroyi]|uniref:Uncharacterized protein n=1 Tax=Decorospora gaudefroyi TaxID=184978 RepID=A0A6A5K3J4_9PLEO|nr:hypothetical protein BDW02DRAFT_37121 [Decorospora gaudefroyi]